MPRLGLFMMDFCLLKEVFAGEVLDRYFAYVSGLVEAALAQDRTPPIGRLRRYLDVITSKLEAHDWARGCMIGNLSLETAVHSEPLRLQLVAIFERWRQPFAACIAEGQAAGDVTRAFDPDDLADFLLSSWQGAMLRMKVERSPRSSGSRTSSSALFSPGRRPNEPESRQRLAARAGRRAQFDHVLCRGRNAGPTVLFLHGNPTSSHIFGATSSRMSRRLAAASRLI